MIATSKEIKKASAIIKKGGLVAFPTETVYGLGASVFNPKAVARIFEVKNRPRFDPLIVHVANASQIKDLCRLNKTAKKLIKRFWPGPLTLVLPKTQLIPYVVTAGLATVAVRMPSHPMAQKLIRLAGVPLAAPSANPFGYLSPTTAQQVREQVGKKIDMVLDGGKCSVGIESTIIGFEGNKIVLLRLGGVPVEEIEKVAGKIKMSTLAKNKPNAPGQLRGHYAPKTPLRVVKHQKIKLDRNKRAGLLAFKFPPQKGLFKKIEVLSPRGDLKEAAANFFSCLYRLDKANLDIIYAETVPNVGLGRAIMDRLGKAGTRDESKGTRKTRTRKIKR